MIVRAERSFRRALAINPELSIAHSLYAQLELETNRAKEALVRLLGRARERRADPQLFAGLVQSCRYLGLLKASRAAHERAKQLDPTVQTSVAYTWRMMGDVERGVIEARLNADPVCRFSEGRDPTFSKPFPPDLSTRLSARHAPSGCPKRPMSVYTFAS